MLTNLSCIAKKEGFDVFNALNILENDEVFDELRFKRGDGNFYFYLFNYRLPTLRPVEIGFVPV